MQESNSCFTSRTFSCCRSCCPSASPESQVVQRHSAPTPHIRHVAPWRLGYKHVSSTNFSLLVPGRGGHCGVEGAQSSLQSATQRGRHRGQSHLQRPVDRLHQSNLIVRLKAAQLGAARARRYRCRGCVPRSSHHYKSTSLYHPKYGFRDAYEAFIHMDQTPVWKVRFPYAPGGTQDYEVRQPKMK
jgi:hypothetical protein